jgi:hypothetical protein
MADTYGPELIANGTFDTDLSGWVEYPTSIGKWVWNTGRAHQLYDENDVIALRQTLTAPLDLNELYEITFSFEYVRSQGDTGILYVYFRDAAGSLISTAAALGIGETGTYTGRFRTPYIAPIAILDFSQSGLRDAEWYIDDVSIKQVTPDPDNSANLPSYCTGTISTGGGGGGDGVDGDGNTICLTGNDWGDNDCGADGTPTWEDPCATPQ